MLDLSKVDFSELIRNGWELSARKDTTLMGKMLSADDGYCILSALSTINNKTKKAFSSDYLQHHVGALCETRRKVPWTGRDSFSAPPWIAKMIPLILEPLGTIPTAARIILEKPSIFAFSLLFSTKETGEVEFFYGGHAERAPAFDHAGGDKMAIMVDVKLMAMFFTSEEHGLRYLRHSAAGGFANAFSKPDETPAPTHNAPEKVQ